MDDDRKYNQIKLWEYIDTQVTSNGIDLGIRTTNSKYGIQPLSIDVNIFNYKNRLRVNFIISYQALYNFLAKFKVFNSAIEKYGNSSNIKSDDINKTVTSFSIEDFRKIVTSLVVRPEYGGYCVKVSVGEKNKDNNDLDGVYMSISDYYSFIKLLSELKDNYITHSINSVNSSYLVDIKTEIEKTNTKLTEFFSTYVATKRNSDNHNDIKLSSTPLQEFSLFNSSTIDAIHEKFLSSSSSTLDSFVSQLPKVEPQTFMPPVKEPKKDATIELANLLSENKKVHDDLSSFLDVNRDKMEIGVNLDGISNDVKLSPKVEEVINYSITSGLLKNNICNLEMYLMNCVNDVNPIGKFVSLIENFYGKSLNINSNDFNRIQYLFSLYIKKIFVNHFDKREKLPAVVPPIILDPKHQDEYNFTLMYDLFLFFVYFNSIKNQLSSKDNNTINNKEFISFLIKTMCSFLIFSYSTKVSKDVVVAMIIKRFEQYKQDKVFDEFENKIYDTYKFRVDVNSNIINDEVLKIYDAVDKNKSKFTLKNFYDKCKETKIISLDYELFNSTEFNQEQILKIILLELNYSKNKKIDFEEIAKTFNERDFTTIPETILSVFDVGKKKYNTFNLTRYIKDEFKNDSKLEEYLKVCKLINCSYYDLVGQPVDFSILPEKVLKAILMWDLEINSKIMNDYKYYMDLIEKSSLDYSMVLSMFKNLKERQTSNYIESLEAVNKIGA